MPRTQRQIKAKIDELQSMAERNPDGKLSRANDLMLQSLNIELEFEGKDQFIVVQPAGAVSGPSDEAFVIGVPAGRAAQQLSNPNSGGERARLATPEEIKAYLAYEAARTARAKQKISDDQVAAAQAQIQSMLGIAGTPVPLTPQEELKPPAVGPIAAEEDAPIPPVVMGDPELAVGDPTPQAEATPLSDEVTGMLRGGQEEALRAAGYDSMEKLANADIDALAANVSGVGKATAAKLVAEASAGLADD